MPTSADSPGNAEPSKTYDVIVVGLGPTGATLANLLGLCGLSTLVLEREAAAYHLPRAVHFDDEVMRVFQTIGVAEEVTKTVRVNPGMRFVDTAGKLLLDWPRPQEVGPNGWHASYRFHQPDLEKILRDALKRFDQVDVYSRANVLQVEDRGDHAEVQYEDLASGQKCSAAARYVVGCDGARSLLRQLIGTEMEDLGFRERWLVIDVLLKQPKPELGDHTIQHCNPSRPSTYVRCPENRRRWEIAVLDGEESDEISSAGSVWQLLEPWLSPDEAVLERQAVYTFHSTIARRWRKGRLLIAGDAAHLTPPFMGQGMCAGIRDAANLAWKLALCIRALADDKLLESYESERLPHVREFIQTAVRLGGLINTCGTEEALRAALPQADGSARMESILPNLGLGPSAGCDTHRGQLFPQPRLQESGLMDDTVGYAPLLLADQALLNADELTQPALSEAGVGFLSTDGEPELGDHIKRMGAKAVLVRPDRYILGTAANKTELASLLAGAYPSPLNRTLNESDLKL
ncbi:bifunctional 3-(3-hydroxy-phenyl)propionate/3-hydroxycinnamic acid hydroxylase [Pelagibius sp. Alg239-R121]|uniref:bifunctional 3-(3-hydroxy-phenyl)propionate/3-hydroxycinnamic acid hydroxylase MhpA n=1 Tax=Pelagibius sp. Alg239-R121 TaxID=2993448 RepID=UPI0024A7A00D|nr:bifunctional 3-(3-hydroxy-phenyl)propionate/3-hydroxycinnamic acid hydroxylase [Pelagibius sp. Alg239-R121]